MKTMTKTELRKEMKTVLASLDPVSKAFESMGKCVSFIQSQKFRSADVILGFMPMRDEVDVLPVLRTGLQQGKKILLPKIVNGTNQMDFYYITDEPNEQTEANSWGIYEPKDSLEKCNLDLLVKEIDTSKIVVLVPGLAFCKDGRRLGRGKGFYDCFLSVLNEKTAEKGMLKPFYCGVCYKSQILESVPFEENDVRVDLVL